MSDILLLYRRNKPVVNWSLLGSLPSGLTFSRAGNATMFDATGKLVWAPANMTRPSSHTTAYPWNSTNADRAQTDIYSSEDNARYGLLTETLVSGLHYAAPTAYASLVTGQKYTLSVYLKKGTADYIQFSGHTTGFSANAFVNFSFLTGEIVKSGSSVVGTPIVRALSGGDYRISFECLAVSSGAQANGNVCFINNDPNADIDPSYLGTGMTVYAGGIQVEPTSYNSPLPLNVTTSNLYFAPRFDHDPSTLALRGLLMEESRQNIYIKSTNGAENMFPLGSGCTKGDGLSGSSVLGVGTAGTIYKSSTTTDARVQNNATVTAETPYTCTLYLEKPASFNGEYVAFGEIAEANGLLVINPYSGTIAQHGSHLTSYSVEDAGLWWRMRVTVSMGGTTFAAAFYPAFNTNGSVTEMSAIGTGYKHTTDGLQLESGSFATSYIPTYGATATRAADSLYTTNIPWFNATQGSFALTYIPIGDVETGTARPVNFSNGTTAEVIGFYGQVKTNALVANIQIGGTGYNSDALGQIKDNENKIAISYLSGKNNASRGGVLVTGASFLTSSLPTGINRLDIMNTTAGNRSVTGYIRSFRYWNYALSSAQLQAVTKV